LVEWESVLHDAAERVQSVRDRLAASGEGKQQLGRGASGDVTMRVDEEAENEIVQAVREKGDVRVVAEEGGESGSKDSRWTVIIDPIDGSSNFERDIPFYCTSIAVLEGTRLSDVTHAIVRNLVNGDTYYAEAAGYATRNGTEIRTNDTLTLKDAMLGIDLSKTNRQQVTRVAELLTSSRRQVHFGANALEACFLAEGKIDGFLDIRGRLRIMDFAGAYLIASRAGAVFSDDRGKALSPEISMAARLSVVGAANATLHRLIIERLP
jgi:myo-inositol-1(or 4)-monophosphatase